MVLRFLGRLLRKRKGRVTGHFPALARGWDEARSQSGCPSSIEAVTGAAEEMDAAGLRLMGEESALLLDAEAMPGFREDAGRRWAISPSRSGSWGRHSPRCSKSSRPAGRSPGREAGEPRGRRPRLGLPRPACAPVRDRRIATGSGAEEIGGNDIFWLEALKGGRGEREGTEKTVRAGHHSAGHRAAHAGGGLRADQDRALHLRDSHRCRAASPSGRGGSGSPDRIGQRAAVPLIPVSLQLPEQVLLGVPTDAPAPDSPKHKEFLARFISRALLAEPGGRPRALYLLQPAVVTSTRPRSRHWAGQESDVEAGRRRSGAASGCVPGRALQRPFCH